MYACMSAHVLKCSLLLLCGACSDPKVYEVQRAFTGTKEAWLDAVNAMEVGWVSTRVLRVKGVDFILVSKPWTHPHGRMHTYTAPACYVLPCLGPIRPPCLHAHVCTCLKPVASSSGLRPCMDTCCACHLVLPTDGGSATSGSLNWISLCEV